MSREKPVDRGPLGEVYEVMGELAGRKDAQAWIGMRRADRAGVFIVVARAPDGDEGNALSHLAADTNLLATIGHRNLLPIVEGRWLGTDAFAVVSKRTRAPTLDGLLSRETLPYPRIAAILQEINGLLEWAREHKIVHRTITPDTLVVQPGKDRLLASFAISAIPPGGMSALAADARTIARLAKAMLVRHELPKRIVEETEALLKLPVKTDVAPDIHAYVSLIAMADALKQGEAHIAATAKIVETNQRLAREQLEKERREHEQAMTEQKQQFAREREQFERELAKEHKALAKEREALAKEQAAHETDRAALIAERAAHESDQVALKAKRAAHESDRAALRAERTEHARDAAALPRQLGAETEALRQQIHAETEALNARASLYAHTEEISTPTGDERPGIVPVLKPSRRWWTRAWAKRPTWKRDWNKPAAAASLVLIIGASAFEIGRNRRAAPRPRITAVLAAPTIETPEIRLVDSAAGAVDSAAGAIDSGAGAVASQLDPYWGADSLAVGPVPDAALIARLRRPRPARRVVAPLPVDSTPLFIVTPEDSTARTDSTVNVLDGPAPIDSGATRDTVSKPKPDTVPNLELAPKRNSVPTRHSVPRADSLTRRDSSSVRQN